MSHSWIIHEIKKKFAMGGTAPAIEENYISLKADCNSASTSTPSDGEMSLTYIDVVFTERNLLLDYPPGSFWIRPTTVKERQIALSYDTKSRTRLGSLRSAVDLRTSRLNDALPSPGGQKVRTLSDSFIPYEPPCFNWNQNEFGA